MEKINIVELLKNCPRGMELDCTICNCVKFIELDRNPYYPIVVIDNNSYEFSLTKYGQVHNSDNAKCVIFPKGKDSWEGFVPPVEFKDGDIVAYDNVSSPSTVFIYRNYNPDWNTSYFVALSGRTEKFFKDASGALNGYNPDVRFATEEEKEKLFKAIKDKGYKWNPETKTLEKLIKPKFKVGDIIRDKDWYKVQIAEVNIKDAYYECGICNIGFDEQDDWKLVPDKFDLSTLKPYKSEVLYRNTLGGYWKPAFWGAYIPENSEQHSNHNFLTTDGFTRYCIPYVGNEHLLGKQADCSDFYKTWEE